MASIPHLPRIVSTFAKMVVALVPRRILLEIVKIVATMPDDAANVTMEFISSSKGVQQAL